MLFYNLVASLDIYVFNELHLLSGTIILLPGRRIDQNRPHKRHSKRGQKGQQGHLQPQRPRQGTTQMGRRIHGSKWIFRIRRGV